MRDQEKPRSYRLRADGVVAQAILPVGPWPTTPPRTLWSLRDIS